MTNYSVEDRYKRKEDKAAPPRLTRGPSGDVQAKLLEVKKYLTSLGFGNLLVEDDEPEFPPKPNPIQSVTEPIAPRRDPEDTIEALQPAMRMTYEETHEAALRSYEVARRIYDDQHTRYVEHLKFHNVLRGTLCVPTRRTDNSTSDVEYVRHSALYPARLLHPSLLVHFPIRGTSAVG